MPDTRLTIEPRPSQDSQVHVLRMSGSLVMESTQEFQKALRGTVAAVVILDLTGVTFLDSAGVGTLVQARAALQRENRRLALVGVAKQVRGVLEITRVYGLFTVFSTLAEAEQHFRSSSAASR